jgi:SAM-dependent methyltransferase
MTDRWDDLITAESYAQHVDYWGIYRQLNHGLARFALEDWKPADKTLVLDLACGTGATLEALLVGLPWDTEVLGVDAAAAMIEQAKLRVPDQRVTWLVQRVEDLLIKPTGPFDLITCGAAFWHFDASIQRPLMESLTAPGRLAFNLPMAQCVGESSAPHPIQAALADLLVQHTQEFPAIHPLFDRREFAENCSEWGFDLRWKSQEWKGPQAALIDLLRIPAIAEMVAPALQRNQLEALIEEAAGRVDGDQLVSVGWWLACVTRV